MAGVILGLIGIALAIAIPLFVEYSRRPSLRVERGDDLNFDAGLVLGIGGTLGVQAATDQSNPPPASNPDFRSEVREGLAEEWGDTYAECIEAAQSPETLTDRSGETTTIPGIATAAERRECRRQADAILP